MFANMSLRSVEIVGAAKAFVPVIGCLTCSCAGRGMERRCVFRFRAGTLRRDWCRWYEMIAVVSSCNAMVRLCRCVLSQW